MLTTRYYCLLALVTAVLGGCAAMNKQECLVGDWHTVGFEDGAKGNNVTRIADYRKACAKYGVAPDLDSYRGGYELGLQTYCQESNGFAVGSSGGRYQGVCPAGLEEQYLQGYRPGRQLFDMRAAVDHTAGQLAARSHELRENRKLIAQQQAGLMDEGTPAQQRVLLGTEIYRLSRQQVVLEDDIVALERELAVRQDELYRFRSTLAFVPR